MLLLTSSSVTTLLLALHSFSGVIAAPASDKAADIDITYGRDGKFGFLPALDSKESKNVSTKAKISAENDYKIPDETRPKYHILNVDTSSTLLGVDPIYVDAKKGDDTGEDDDDDDDSKEKRSVFAQLFTRAISSDQKEALSLHNAARKKVKVDALKWDTKLASDALAYAKKIAKAGKMVHSDGKTRPGQGENLAYAWSSDGFKNPMTAGTQSWLNEKKKYKGETIPKGNFSQYGHYTQCVWEKSTKVGIAAAKDSKGAWYTVARYSAAGNVVGQKPY
ncbi:hypothetical protein FLONG3_4774 [Fusarium longipes]|uniref:SCP domain-containing protein n=1 Tax=Fusarium longipes TaxID=694270 RepID=A0A395SYR4_9HYPO|nr:hypothetical protein FLONG3_4774 [Fusarium longipes]